MTASRSPAWACQSRRGVATLWVLIIMLSVSALLAVIAWQSLAGRRWLDQRQKRIQADWLARAGIELASARLLENSADYKGELIEPMPGAKILIEIKSAPGPAKILTVTSEARFPTDDQQPVMRTLTRRFRRVVEKDTVRLEPVLPPSAK